MKTGLGTMLFSFSVLKNTLNLKSLFWIKMSVEIKIETLDSVITPLKRELLPANYEELTLNKEKVQLDPDWDKYYELERLGKLVIITIRNTGHLSGYAFFIVDTSLHYKSLTVANNDVIYVIPSLRGASGFKFLRFCHIEMSSRADKVTFHVKDFKNWGPILSRFGYAKEDSLWGFLR
jgi:hypothetical protein